MSRICLSLAVALLFGTTITQKASAQGVTQQQAFAAIQAAQGKLTSFGFATGASGTAVSELEVAVTSAITMGYPGPFPDVSSYAAEQNNLIFMFGFLTDEIVFAVAEFAAGNFGDAKAFADVVFLSAQSHESVATTLYDEVTLIKIDFDIAVGEWLYANMYMG